ncbi:MAG TPA: helix-turn-helix domain-containing protein [Actinocrinis sp.]|nr:helix-turn-helix domain-containing protein [Actinocrinis sp.]
MAGVADVRDFGWQLTLVRERAGLTVREVAKATGLPSSTVGDYFGGRHLPPVRAADLLPAILAACSVTDPEVVAQWMRTLTRIRHATATRKGGEVAPYRGLASFQPEHAGWFFGREELTGQLLGRIARSDPGGGALLIVVGPSGSGKSSLLRAGLIPAIDAMEADGPRIWRTLLLIPGLHPLRTLREQMAAITGPTVDGDGDGDGDGDQPSETAHSARLLLVIDQFEEVFTTCSDPDERRSLISALGTVATESVVVLGMRADFYPHALQHPLLAHALQHAQVVVGPMSDAQLRRAILEPARKADLTIAEDLVEILLREFAPPAGDHAAGAAHDAGALPLLSHALLATWKLSRRGRLTLADYRGTGGIHGAVAYTAEGVFGQLTPSEQDLTRRLFLRLVHVAEDTADTRRRVAVSELLPGGDQNHSQEQNHGQDQSRNQVPEPDLGPVIARFIGQRLITADSDTVEITHEALLSAWPRLRGWIDADRAGLQVHRRLTDAARTWDAADRDPHALYRGSRLTAAREWAQDSVHARDLNAVERDFLADSVDRDLADARAVRRRTHRLRRLVASLTALVVVSGLLTAYAFHERTAATIQRDLAISRQVAIEANQLRGNDVSLSMQLALAAYRIAPTPEARASVLDSYAGPASTRMVGPASVTQSIALTAGGRVLASGGTASSIQLWDVSLGARPVAAGPPLTGHTGTVFSVAFSPDGRILASGGADTTVRLWNVADPGKAAELGRPLSGPSETVYSVAFSPDGHLLAAGGADDRIWLWDVSDPAHPRVLGPPLTGATGYVQAVAFSPDGDTLAAGSLDTTVRLWDVAAPGRPIALGPALTGPDKGVMGVAFSPDGRTLAAGSADKTVRLWNITDLRHPAPLGPALTGPASWVNSVAFSPDGQSLAAGSSDDKVWVWNLATRVVTASLPHPAPVTSVVFEHDDHTVATGAADGVARIWDLPGPIMTGPTQPVFSATFGTGDQVLAVTSPDDTAQLWNVTDPRHPAKLGPTLRNTAGPGRPSGASALSPDGRTLAIGTLDGSLQLWDVSDPDHPKTLAVRLTGLTAAVQSIDFSPDGRILTAGGNDHRTALWSVADPDRPVPLGQPLTGPANYVYSPVISPDGKILAVGSADDEVWLWSLSDPAHPTPLGPPLTGPTSYVYSVAFSPDGKVLAAGSADDKVRLWNLSDPAHPTPLGPALTGPATIVYSVAFSPDGSTLAASTGDGTIWLWNLADPVRPSLLATLAGQAGAQFVATFDSDRPLLATAGDDETVQLWDIDTDQVAAFICATSGTPISAAEWNQYIPGLPYNPPCGNG